MIHCNTRYTQTTMMRMVTGNPEKSNNHSAIFLALPAIAQSSRLLMSSSAHSDHRLVHPTIWTCDDDADRSPSKSDGVVDLSVQHGHQLHAVLYHPLAPVFEGSRSHRLVFHQAAHSLSVEGGIA